MNFNQDTSSPIKFTPGKDSSYSSGGDEKTRPTGDPRGRKDFKKVLERSDEEEGQATSQGVQDEGAEAVAMLGSVKPKKKPSLFDLTSSAKSTKKAPMLGSEGDAESSANVYGKTSADKKPITITDDAPENPAYVAAPEDKSKFTTRFETAQPDLSSVNPMAAAQQQQPLMTTQSIGQPQKVDTNINLQAVIDQLVNKVVELKVNDKTETTITLKHPPLFQNANIVVTSFDSAKGEFNISFENLTQQAKNILDMQVNRESLLSALHQRGYAVHIVNTTTLVEHPTIVAEAQPGREPDAQQRGREEPGQDQPRRQRG